MNIKRNRFCFFSQNKKMFKSTKRSHVFIHNKKTIFISFLYLKASHSLRVRIYLQYILCIKEAHLIVDEKTDEMWYINVCSSCYAMPLKTNIDLQIVQLLFSIHYNFKQFIIEVIQLHFTFKIHQNNLQEWNWVKSASGLVKITNCTKRRSRSLHLKQ